MRELTIFWANTRELRIIGIRELTGVRIKGILLYVLPTNVSYIVWCALNQIRFQIFQAENPDETESECYFKRCAEVTLLVNHKGVSFPVPVDGRFRPINWPTLIRNALMHFSAEAYRLELFRPQLSPPAKDLVKHVVREQRREFVEGSVASSVSESMFMTGPLQSFSNNTRKWSQASRQLSDSAPERPKTHELKVQAFLF